MPNRPPRRRGGLTQRERKTMSNTRRTAARQKPQITQQEVDALAAAVEEIGERIEASATRIAERFHHELSNEGISVCDLQSKMRSLKESVDKTDEFLGTLYEFAIGR